MDCEGALEVLRKEAAETGGSLEIDMKPYFISGPYGGPDRPDTVTGTPESTPSSEAVTPGSPDATALPEVPIPEPTGENVIVPGEDGTDGGDDSGVRETSDVSRARRILKISAIAVSSVAAAAVITVAAVSISRKRSRTRGKHN